MLPTAKWRPPLRAATLRAGGECGRAAGCGVFRRGELFRPSVANCKHTHLLIAQRAGGRLRDMREALVTAAGGREAGLRSG